MKYYSESIKVIPIRTSKAPFIGERAVKKPRKKLGKKWRKVVDCAGIGCVEMRKFLFGGIGYVEIRNTVTPSNVVSFSDDEWAAFKEQINGGRL